MNTNDTNTPAVADAPATPATEPATVPTPATATATKPARRASTTTARRTVPVPPLPRRVNVIGDIDTIMRHIDAHTANGRTPDDVLTIADNIIARYRTDPGPTVNRSVSVVDGTRVEHAQNRIVRMVPAVSNVAFTTACRIMFPRAVGMFTAGSIADGIRIASGIRAEWTRHGHADPTWRTGMTAPDAAPGPTVANARAWIARRAARTT